MSEIDPKSDPITMIDLSEIKEIVSFELSQQANDASILAIDANNHSSTSNKLAVGSMIVAVIALITSVITLFTH